MRPVNYHILGNKHNTDLEKEVHFHLDHGWKLFGSPFTDGEQLYQCMVIKTEVANVGIAGSTETKDRNVGV